MFDSIDEAFHNVAEFVLGTIVLAGAHAFAGRDHRGRSAPADRVSQGVAIVAFVGDDVLRRKVF